MNTRTIMPRQDLRATGRHLIGVARGLVLVVLVSAVGCTDDGRSTTHVELVGPSAPARSTSGDMPLSLSFYPSSEIYVEETASSVDYFDNISYSRCPDEPRNPARTIFLRGRTFTVTAQDQDAPGQPLVHFVIESDQLRFLAYTSRGSSLSKAKYALNSPIMSDDLKYVAPAGAVTVMSCRNGFYIGPSSIFRTYKGSVRLEGIAPVFGTGLAVGCTDNEPASSEYNPYSSDASLGCNPGGNGGYGSGGIGQQYYPGDYTNGETVSWATGVGNGGASSCGSAAQVDYVCIDEWNPTTGEWEVWGCGYVTTC